MRGWIATAAAAALLVTAAPAAAQLPIPLPPIGPPGGLPTPQPPPQSQPPSAQPPGSPPTGSVTVGVNATHTGFVDDQNLVPPLVRRWARSFGGPVGPVRAADGRVYTLASDRGTFALRALNPLTGRDLWVRPLPRSNHLAYDGARLFAVGLDGVIRAFSASNGAPIWQRSLSSGALGASPVATGGVVYVVAQRSLFALSGATGAQLWKASTDGDDNVPAVDSQRAYVANACADVRAFNRSNGQAAWRRPDECGARGGSTPSVLGSALYVPERSLVLNTSTGGERGSFFGTMTPAFGYGYGVFRNYGIVRAEEMASGKVRWSHPGESDEQYSSSSSDQLRPMAAYHSVYRLTPGGVLYALSLETGKQIWRTNLGAQRGASGVTAADRVAIAPGLLLIPRGRRLVAFQSYFRPAPNGIAFEPYEFDLPWGHRTDVDGVIGANLRGPSARVRIEYDEHPFRGFTAGASGPTAPDGYFLWTVRPDLNLRLRFRSGNAVSAVRTVYVYPRTRWKFRRPSRNRVRAVISFSNVRSVNLGGRRASLYVVRLKQRRFDRLGSSKVRRKGRGRSAVTIAFNALRHVGRRDYLAICVKGQTRLGLGRPDRFMRRCGARRIR
jgi:outer membrane protein assembly factor BamB